MSVVIRRAQKSDYQEIWGIFSDIVSKGETYAFPTDTGREEAIALWLTAPSKTFVAVLDNKVIGTYYIKPNHPGPGSHICNCGYMVLERTRGKGVASAMCEHSQRQALRMGFKGMQFNLVVSTNSDAIRLWKKLGFDIIGTLPKSFNHRKLGLVDAHVMYKWLEPAGE